MELTARDIMDAQVICIQADATVKEALEFLVAPPLPGVLVLDAAGHLVGTLAMLDVMEGAEPMGGAVRTEIGAGDSGLEFYEYDSRFCEAPGKMATVRLNEMMDKTRAILGPAVMNRPARERMSTTLISVEASAPVAQVVAMLCDRQIDRLIVVEGGKPCGLVEMAEVIAAIAGGKLSGSGASTALGPDRDAAESEAEKGLMAGDILDAAAVAVRDDVAVAGLLLLLSQRQLCGVPVLDGAGHLVGTVTLMDIMATSQTFGADGQVALENVFTQVAADAADESHFDLGEIMERAKSDAGAEYYRQRLEQPSPVIAITDGGDAVSVHEMADKIPADLKVREVMSTALISVVAATPVTELAGLLHARGLRQVTIVEDGKFCGLVGVKQIFGAVIAGRLR